MRLPRPNPSPTRLARRALVVIGALLLVACGGPSLDPIGEGPSPTSTLPEEAGDASVAWTHLDVAEGVLDDEAAAAVVDDADDIAAVWDELGFETAAPELGADRVLLLLGRPDNACPDDPIELRVEDGRLITAWQEPPGGCVDPLIRWVHAFDVHRGVLAPGFTYGPAEPFADELREVTIEVAGADSEIPPPPEPPAAMSDEEVDAVFDGHRVERCGPEHDPIAAAFGDPDREVDDAGFEGDPSQDTAIRDIDAALEVLAEAGFDVDERVSGLVDRSEGEARAAVVVHLDDADRAQTTLDEALGTGTVTVWPDPWDPSEVRAAQEALTALMGATDEPGAIVSASGPPGPVQLGMVDPTRDALDEIAATVDADLVCVEVLRSGLAPQPTG